MHDETNLRFKNKLNRINFYLTFRQIHHDGTAEPVHSPPDSGLLHPRGRKDDLQVRLSAIKCTYLNAVFRIRIQGSSGYGFAESGSRGLKNI